MRKKINIKISILAKILALSVLVMLMPGNSYAIPVPHGAGGTIFELDGITPARNGIEFYVQNLNSGRIVNGRTGSGGRYAASIEGDDGNMIVIKAWNKYNQVNATLTLKGVMRNVNLLLNMTYPQAAPAFTSEPKTAALEDQPYSYQAEVFDENDDLIEFGLAVQPIGMEISSSGLVRWAPKNEDVGVHGITITANDGHQEANQTFFLVVENTNDVPIIISAPNQNASEGLEYHYDADAIDEDGDILSYALAASPSGMAINETSGLVAWKPNSSQVGQHHLIVNVSDGISHALQEFSISVGKINDLPIVTSLPVTVAVQNQAYVYEAKAYDLDGDLLTYSLAQSQKGMAMGNLSGRLEWVPGPYDIGAHNITIKVSDNDGFSLQSYTLFVEDVNDAPAITSVPSQEAIAGKRYSYDAEAHDPDNDLLAYTLAEAPKGMKIDKNSGLVEWKPKKTDAGANKVAIEVSDGSLSGRQEFFIIVSDEKNHGRPSEKSVTKELGEGTRKSTVTVAVKSSKEAGLNELAERPKDAARLSKAVYKYLKIESAGEADEDAEAMINFSVGKKWLKKAGVNQDDIILLRFTSSGWQELFTENTSTEADHVLYTAKTPGFSYFAISVKDGTATKNEPEPMISRIEAPFRIAGTAYKFGRLGQMPGGTKITFVNMNSSQTTELVTGEGSGIGSGAYYAIIPGNFGDSIKIRIEGIEKERVIGLKDLDRLDLLLNLKGNSFNAVTGSAFFAVISDTSVISALLAAVMIAAVIFTILKKPKHKKR